MKKRADLLLVEKKYAFGLKKNIGDFTMSNGKVRRYLDGDQIIYYSGMQMINLEIFGDIKENKFSLKSEICFFSILKTPTCLNWCEATPDSPKFPPNFWNIVLIFEAVLFLLSVKASIIIAIFSGPKPS